VKNVLSSKKPSFYVRLSSLIVIQVVFVFAVLAMILFVPGDHSLIEAQFNDLEQSAFETGWQFESANVPENNQFNESPVQLTDTLLFQYMKSRPSILTARVYGLLEDRELYGMWTYQAADNTGNEAVDIETLVNPKLIRYTIKEPFGQAMAVLASVRHSVYYYHLTDIQGQPAVLTAVVDHDLIISQRSDLIRYLRFVFDLDISFPFDRLSDPETGQTTAGTSSAGDR